MSRRRRGAQVASATHTRSRAVTKSLRFLDFFCPTRHSFLTCPGSSALSENLSATTCAASHLSACAAGGGCGSSAPPGAVPPAASGPRAVIGPDRCSAIASGVRARGPAPGGPPGRGPAGRRPSSPRSTAVARTSSQAAPAGAAWEEVLATAVDLGLLGRRPAGPRPGGPPGAGPRALTPEAIAEHLSGPMTARGPEAAGGTAPGGADEPQPPPAAQALKWLAAQVVAERFSLRAELPGQVRNEWRVGQKKSRNRNDLVTALDRVCVALATCAPRRRRLIALLAPKSVMPHRWRA